MILHKQDPMLFLHEAADSMFLELQDVESKSRRSKLRKAHPKK